MKIKDRLPAVRNEILLLISSKEIDDLLTTEGKQKLAQEIRVRTARSLGVEVAEPEPAEEKPKTREGCQGRRRPRRGRREAEGQGQAQEEEGPAGEPDPQVLFSQFIVQ
jgi:hypothetical protein